MAEATTYLEMSGRYLIVRVMGMNIETRATSVTYRDKKEVRDVIYTLGKQQEARKRKVIWEDRTAITIHNYNYFESNSAPPQCKVIEEEAVAKAAGQ